MKYAVSIMNQKGGTGKTTLAVHLAATLAGDGRRVLLIDNDPQANATTWLGEKRGDAVAVLYRDKDAQMQPVETRENLHLLPSSYDLTSARDQAAADAMNGPYRLADRASVIDEEYEAVVIDNSPASDILTLNSLALLAELGGMEWAVGVAAPVTASSLDVAGLAQLEQTVEQLSQRLPNAPALCAIVPSVCNQSEGITGDVIEQLQSEYNGLVTPRIRKSVRIKEAPAAGQTMYEYRPGGKSEDDLRAVAEAVLANLNA